MPQTLILDAVRTARGKRKGGSLNGVHPMDLAAHVYRAVLERNAVDPMQVDDAVLGCVTQIGEQGLNIARGAILAAGLPIEIPGVTVNRFCGSGLQAVNQGAQSIAAGSADLVLAGGVESMSRVPMGADAAGPGDGPMSPALQARFPNLIPQGLSAEMIAEQWNLSRSDLDAFAAESQRRAGEAIEAGRFAREIVPMEVPDGEGGTRRFDRDEHVRPGTTAESLAGLPPAFKEDGTIHAGNSSGIVDGAAAVLLASPEKAEALGLKPRARILSMAVAGSDPVIMLTGPIPSTKKALARAGLTIDDIDLFEVNEAFASVPLAVARDCGMDLQRVNVNGGAIALGHPLGATGAMLVATLLGELERRDLKRGLVTLCIGYGMGITTIIERVP
jgi:acetyl-CoA acyltransferase